MYTDGSQEFKSALHELGWCHDTSTPYRSQTNGVAERSVRKVKEGTSCALAQSGFEVQWWPEAMTCYCFLHGVTDVMQEGFTPYKSKFLKDFKGDKNPLRCRAGIQTQRTQRPYTFTQIRQQDPLRCFHRLRPKSQRRLERGLPSL